MLAMRKSCGDTCIFDQHYQIGKIVDGIIYTIFLALTTFVAEIVIEEIVMHMVKGFII